MSLAKVFSLVLSAALLASIPAWPQTNVGQISGKVFDSTGAVVPKCAITATNLETGLKQSATTDEGGTYSFPSLPRGTYTVRAEAAGFRSSEQSGVLLDAATRRALDFTLVLGALSEAISVVAAADQVQTTSGDVSQLITERQLTQIALNGRNYVQMLQLVPGVVTTSTDPFSLGLSSTAQRINGIRTNSIYFMVDGTDNMDNGANSNAIINPNIDAIAEIKILTSSYSAEFGGRAGAIMNVVMKGGTREFHGSLFEFVRNDSFDARSFFSKDAAAALQQFRLDPGRPALHSGQVERGQEQVVLLRRPGVEVQPSRRRANQHRADTGRACGRLPQFILAGPRRPADRAGVCQPHGSRRALLQERTAAAEAVSAAQLRRTGRQLFRQRGEPHRHARGPAESGLHPLAEHPGLLPLDPR